MTTRPRHGFFIVRYEHAGWRNGMRVWRKRFLTSSTFVGDWNVSAPVPESGPQRNFVFSMSGFPGTLVEWSIHDETSP